MAGVVEDTQGQGDAGLYIVSVLQLRNLNFMRELQKQEPHDDSKGNVPLGRTALSGPQNPAQGTCLLLPGASHAPCHLLLTATQ